MSNLITIVILLIAAVVVAAQIAETIKQFQTQRQKAADKLKEGQRLHRTTFEAIEEKGLTEPKALYAEFQKIEAKESRLSASERQLISEIALLSMQVVFTREIDKARKAGEIKQGIPKKKRTKKTTTAKKATTKK